MYFYSYSENDTIHQVLLDDFGTPVAMKQEDSKDVSASPDTIKKLKDQPNMLMVGEVVTMDSVESLENMIQPDKVREPIELYFDDPIFAQLEKFSSDDEWESFFEQNHIKYEVKSTKEKYQYH